MSNFVVGVFLPEKNISDHPFDVDYYRQAYFELSQEISALNGEMVIVREEKTYQGKGLFSRAWKMLDPLNYQLLGATKIDVLFDKGEFVLKADLPIFNHPDLNHVCTDKFAMYERFKQFCPLTLLVNNQQEYFIALEQISTDKAVIKPLAGQEGIGILIDSTDKLSNEQIKTFPIVVQEFLDTSKGVPGIVEDYHDLRIALFDGEIIYSYLRTPPPGRLTANVSQGGKFVMVEPKQLPEEVLPIVQAIDAELAYVGHRFYCIDFGITPDGPKIIEMNSRLGLLPNQDSSAFVEVKKKLAKTFAEMSQA